MRYLILVLLSVSLSLSASAETLPKIKFLKNKDPQRILFVGNSYLFYGDGIHNHVRRMVKAANFHQGPLKVKLASISGAHLSDHCLSCLLTNDRLRVGKPFDVVILQDHSATALSSERSTKFKETVAEQATKIRQTKGEPVLYMPHAYVSPHKKASPDMLQKNRKLYTDVGNKVHALVIPVGLAFAEAYRLRPKIKLHKSYDGSHPTLLGTYLAAATVFASLYNVSPVGNPYNYFGKIGDEDARFLQSVAESTVKTYFKR